MIIISVLALHIVGLINLKFTAWPEMLLWPYLMIKGWLPYQDIAIAHTPNLIFALKYFMGFFGVGILQLKLFTWLLIILTDVIFFFVIRKLFILRGFYDKTKPKNDFNKKVTISLLAFIFWQMYFDGNGLWFEIAVLPLSIILFYLFYKKKFFLSGLVFAFAFFTKQTAVWFLLPVIYQIFFFEKNKKEILIKFILGVGSVSLILLLAFWIVGILPSFYRWAINFGIFTLPRSQGQIQFPALRPLFVALFPFLVFLPGLFKKDKKIINLLVWAFAGGFAAYPRFEFFHIQTAIPFLAIATSIFFVDAVKFRYQNLFNGFYLAACLLLFSGFFIRNISEGTRFYDTDVKELQEFIVKNTVQGQKIFIMNYWDNLYPLTDTLPATRPWIPQLGWYVEQPGVQEKMVEELKREQPELVILNPYTESGLSSYVPRKIYDFVTTNYKFKQKKAGMDVLILR